MTAAIEPTPTARRPGRPRDPETDRAILRAAVEVMTEVGLHGTTVAAVAARAGVARATIYLRWPTRDALLGGLARAAGGGFPYVLTGDIEQDIRTGAAFANQVLSGPHFIALLPQLVAAVLTKPPALSFQNVAPNREPFAAIYGADAAGQGFDHTADAHLAFDMLLGAQLAYILAHGAAPPARYSRELATAIVNGLRSTDKERPGKPKDRPPGR